MTKDERARRIAELRTALRTERVRPDVNAAHGREIQHELERLLVEQAKDDAAPETKP